MDVDEELGLALRSFRERFSPHLDALGEKARIYARNARSQTRGAPTNPDLAAIFLLLRRQGFPWRRRIHRPSGLISPPAPDWNGPDDGDERRLAR